MFFIHLTRLCTKYLDLLMLLHLAPFSRILYYQMPQKYDYRSPEFLLESLSLLIVIIIINKIMHI